MGGKIYLGLDIGATSVKAAIYRKSVGVCETFMCSTGGDPLTALRTIVEEIAATAGADDLPFAVTGSGKGVVEARIAPPSENEIIAVARGAKLLRRDVTDFVEVGGQFSKWIRVDENGAVSDYSMNDLCAGGSGSFLEQQASRLQIDVRELARLSMSAARGATIAGRCSVFAKSDMIHLQQKGTPVEEVAYGLCLAVARNFAGTILKGKDLCLPAAFIGGGSLNPGLVRAFREVFAADGDNFFVPELSQHFGAVGACFLAQESGADVTLRQLREALAGNEPIAVSGQKRELAPLTPPKGSGPREEPRGAAGGSPEGFLGVDVGSVSTDLVLIAPDGEVLDSAYLPTRGRPIEALSECLSQLRERHGERLVVLGVGTTGSGRHLAGQFLGADVVKNEITAQMVSAADHFPEVDTILEIGGQDAKYISVDDGAVRDFTMNKVCSAGTGSFLEEQAERLGISIIGEFQDLALASSSPVDLGSRCTVFIDSELVAAQQSGIPLEDIAAGLAYAIVANYLDKVVARGRIGEHIVFQGGVASNRAVVAAFESLLGREIVVHPYNRISGAIGAALLARSEHRQTAYSSRFRGFDALHDHQVKSFECDKCSNLCQVNEFTIGGQAVFFGDACERFSGVAEKAAGSPELPDLFGKRERLLADFLSGHEARTARGTVGIPRAAVFHELYPLWSSFFQRLGYDVELSSPSSHGILERGLRKLSVDTCLPVKVAFGHVLDLVDRDVDFVFMPAVCPLPSPGQGDTRSWPCLYGEHLPYMIKAVSGAARVLAPQIGLGEDRRDVARTLDEMADTLGIDRNETREAFDQASLAHEEFTESIEKVGSDILSQDFDTALVILGRPYNVFDSYQNLNLARHLRRLNVEALPMCFLPLSGVALGEEWDELLWKFNRDNLRAAQLVKQDDRLFPLVLSSFGCGPDGFTMKYLAEVLEDKPHLFLEFDEHRGEAGLVTRLEAFLEEIKTHQQARRRQQGPRPGVKRAARVHRDSTVFLPHFSDHAYAFSGAFRAAGHESHVLPPPSKETDRVGHEFCSGGECHPYVVMAGDLVTLAQSGNANDGDTFFFPAARDFSCLLSQYRTGYQHVLEELGIGGINVRTMHTADMREFFGLSGGVFLWQAMVATDYLVKAACERRPYEVQAGQTDRVHQANLTDIEQGVAEGRLAEAVDRCVQRLSSVAVHERDARPIVGIAGDIYTRANAFSNDELFRRLEEMGCEVWPSPFIVDAFDFTVRRGLSKSIAHMSIGNALGNGMLFALKELGRGRVRRKFMGMLSNLDEPDYDEVLELASPYVAPEANFLVLLNVAKMVDFARKGADGVINAMGLNCMVGTISASLLRAIRADHGDVPMANLIYGETGSVARRARLEAFVHQVKIHHERRKDAGITCAAL
jgi:predicted CoA-substrate-specific enzyme activase